MRRATLFKREEKARRSGAAAAEVAIVLPFLVFLLLIVLDFSRLFSDYQTISNCARNGAVYLSDPFASAEYQRYASVEAAALADANDLNPAPVVTYSPVPDADGNIWVRVTYDFQTVVPFPGIPGTVTLSRTVTMRQTPREPSF
jgi:Flp pilus assembly protein TadG